MELFWGTRHSSAVPWDLLLVLHIHSTWVQVAFRLLILKCLLFYFFHMRKSYNQEEL